VIVLVIQNVGVAIAPLKGEPPIPVDMKRPPSARRALEWMQAEARDVHVVDRLGCVKRRQLHAKPFGVMRLNPAKLPDSKNRFRPLCRNDRIMRQHSVLRSHATRSAGGWRLRVWGATARPPSPA